jgi:putative endonuclease
MLTPGFVYILANGFKRTYIGVTSDLGLRVWQHKNGTFPCAFTERYNIKQLVYFESFGDIREAINREKQLKRWSRIKKIRLIVGMNPDWKDLSEAWGKPTKPFDGTLREPVGFGDGVGKTSKSKG